MYISHAHACCVVCGSPLTVHQQAVGDVCGQPACKGERLKRRLAEDAARRRDVESRSLACRRQAAEACGEPRVEELPLAILPSNPVPVINLPERRRRRFRDHLMQIVSEAAARRCSSTTTDSPADVEDTSEPQGNGDDEQLALWAACCAFCEGDCCRQGGDHAFIEVETILRYMQRHPHERPRQVLAAYLSHVGHKTYQDACVYQGRRGCTLPRDMRADICGSYYCRGLAEFQGEVERGGGDRGFAVAWQDGAIVRSGFVAADEVRVLAPSATDHQPGWRTA